MHYMYMEMASYTCVCMDVHQSLPSTTCSLQKHDGHLVTPATFSRQFVVALVMCHGPDSFIPPNLLLLSNKRSVPLFLASEEEQMVMREDSHGNDIPRMHQAWTTGVN